MNLKKIFLGLVLAGMTVGGAVEIMDEIQEKMDDKYRNKQKMTRKEVVIQEMETDKKNKQQDSAYYSKKRELDKKQEKVFLERIKNQNLVLPEDISIYDGYSPIVDWPIVVREIRNRINPGISDDYICDVILEIALPDIPTYMQESAIDGKMALESMSEQDKVSILKYIKEKLSVNKYREGDFIEFRDDTQERKIIDHVIKIGGEVAGQFREQRRSLHEAKEIAKQNNTKKFIEAADSIWTANKIKPDDRFTVPTDYFER